MGVKEKLSGTPRLSAAGEQVVGGAGGRVCERLKELIWDKLILSCFQGIKAEI